MKIGILQCGRIPDELIGQHDDYDQMCAKLLGDEHFEFAHWAVLDNELPNSATEADGWLITGSKFGAYESHPWIPPLESLIREIYAAGIPLVGICFGHQIMAQALGGKVEKFEGGWSVGHVYYNVDDEDEPVGVHAFHQDQVVEIPADAEVIGSTDFCQYAFLRYRKAAISVQPHPEFNDAYIKDLLRVRAEILPAEIKKHAESVQGQPLATDYMAKTLQQFFLDNKPHA